MTTGLFSTKAYNNQARSVMHKRATKAREPRQQPARGMRSIDVFAEHIAEGLSPREAAAKMHLAARSGDNMFARIRKELGWQAV